MTKRSDSTGSSWIIQRDVGRNSAEFPTWYRSRNYGGKAALLLRLLALIGLLWTGKHALKQAASILRSHGAGRAGSPSPKDDDEIVKDPVCLTYIPKSLAVQKTINEKIWYFCSEECAAKFKEQQTE